MTKISIIMGVYNGESKLARALDSLLNQTYQDFEIIICDDNSRDGSSAVIKEYIAQYPSKVKGIFNVSNMTLAGALNQCLNLAQGEYIARMDQDDFSLPHRLEKQVDILDRYSDISCVGSYIYIDNDDEVKNSRTITINPNLNLLLKGGYAFFHPTIMIRKDCLDSLGRYRNEASCNLCEDLDLWYRFFISNFKGINIEEPLLIYTETKKDFSKRKFHRALIVFKLRNHYRKICGKNFFWNIFYVKSLIFSIFPSNFKYYINSKKYK